jgi:hypothetical protein
MRLSDDHRDQPGSMNTIYRSSHRPAPMRDGYQRVYGFLHAHVNASETSILV